MVIKAYDSRNLKSSTRYYALNDFEGFLERKHPEFFEDISKFPSKEGMKKNYQIDRNERSLKSNQAQSSMVNEVYNQLNLILNEKRK